MADAKRILIIGAGGQAREVRWILEELAAAGERISFGGYIVSDLARLGERDSRDEVVGDFGFLQGGRERFDGLAIGIGTPSVRMKVAAQLEERFGPEWWPTLVHPSVIIDRKTCRIDHGVLLCPGVIATVNVTIGAHTMVNNGCTIGHETALGRGCVVNPGANLSGGVVVDDEVLIGTGAQILQYRRIGRGATVGAGAVVTTDVSQNVTVVGVPARPLSRKRDVE